MDEMEEVYRQFEAFDFDTVDFQNGLENVLESYLDQQNQDKDERIHEIKTEIPHEEKNRLSMQAKTFYFCKATGNIMNIEDYEEWKVKQSQKTTGSPQTTQTSGSEPEYSMNYNQLVEMILEGRESEIPGIKQIPDTILDGHSSESTLNIRKKPWEIAAEQTSESIAGDEAEAHDNDDEARDEDTATEQQISS